MLACAATGPRTVVGVVAFALSIYGLLISLIPYAPPYAARDEALGLLYGTYAVGVLIATPLFGYLGDRIGSRRPMLYGVALSAAALASSGFAPNFYLLLLARLFQRPPRQLAGPSVWR